MAEGPWSEEQAARLAARLRQLRSERGWSYRRAAAASGTTLSPNTIRGIENGSQPDLGTIFALQRAFDLESVEDLLGLRHPSRSFVGEVPLKD